MAKKSAKVSRKLTQNTKFMEILNKAVSKLKVFRLRPAKNHASSIRPILFLSFPILSYPFLSLLSFFLTCVNHKKIPSKNTVRVTSFSANNTYVRGRSGRMDLQRHRSVRAAL